MAKKRHYFKSRKLEIPLAVVAGFAAPTIKIYEHYRQMGGISAAAREAGRILTGFDFWDGRFVPRATLFGLVPIVAGALVHRFVGGRLGVNRTLRNAGIPFIRL